MNLFENHANPHLRQSFQAPLKRDSLKNLLTNMDSHLTDATKIQHTAEEMITDQQEPNNKEIRLPGPKLQIPILKKLPLHELQQIDTGQNGNSTELPKPKGTRYIKLAPLKGHKTPGHINSVPNKIPPLPLNMSMPLSPEQDRLGIADQLNSEKQSTFRNVPPSRFFKRERESIIKDISDDETTDEIEHELDNVLIKFPLLIVNPKGRFKYVWDLLMIGLLMYYCFVLPIRLCFLRVPGAMDPNKATDYDNGWIGADYFLDILVLIDIILNFFTAYEDDEGLIVFKKRKILKHYMARWFLIDLISAFPINRNIFILPHTNFQDIKFSHSNWVLWRVLRLLKLVRIFKLISSIERLFSLFTFNLEKINIIKFVSFITVFMHFSGCIWNMIAELEYQPTWMQEEIGLVDESVFKRYISSLYFGLTVLLTIGFGNIHPSSNIERFVADVWMFFGIIVYTYIISSLTSSFARLNASQSIREEKDLFFRAWNKHFKLPYETLDMILNTVGIKDQSVSTQRIQILNHASKTLADLPKGLYSEIYNTFFHGVIDKILFFRNKPKQFLIRLMPLLKPAIYDQWEYIYKERDPAVEVFFVVKGRVITKCQDRQQVERAQIFVEGSFFGDTDVILKRNRLVEARAETKCELWKIDKEDFLDVLKQFPGIKEEVENLVRIKEAYRKPILNPTNSTTLKDLDDAGDGFQEIEMPPAERGIFSAFTAKMMKKINKGKNRNSNDSNYAYESLDFEPDLPSPVSVTTKNILSEAEWKNFEHSMTQKLVKRRGGIIDTQKLDDSAISEAGSLQQQFKYKNTGVKRRMLKRKENRESLRKNILVKNWNSPSDSVENMAKKKLLEDLQQKQIEITELAQLDEMLNGKEELEKYRDTVIQKAENSENNLEKMFTDAETMLSALEQFEEGLSELMGKKVLE